MFERISESAVFHPVSAHILRAQVTAETPVRVRRADLLAYSSKLTLTTHTVHDYRSMAPESAPQRMVAGVKAIGRRLKPTVTGATLTGGNLHLHVATGHGHLHLGHRSRDVSIFRITDDNVFFLKTARVLAFSDTLQATITDSYGQAENLTDAATHAWQLTGTGEIGIATQSEPTIVPITTGEPLIVETRALLALSGNLTLKPTDLYEARATLRTVGDVASFVYGNDTFGRENVWVEVSGTGSIAIQSAE